MGGLGSDGGQSAGLRERGIDVRLIRPAVPMPAPVMPVRPSRFRGRIRLPVGSFMGAMAALPRLAKEGGPDQDGAANEKDCREIEAPAEKVLAPQTGGHQKHHGTIGWP